ncbi:1-aminocyclopropane-1-carboxylate deaminase/D-cysteine desulfhydrase [Streptomyces candidus]|uniref:1-aminocyclopropane-1-carboxylate deaminase n=1 Tax=Streptomyces candidus TaxID=67283 RepID=A0A7X0HHC3_9ACTN|nr:pyridoxal-phosphate dependent enzyme [Streptomyces candidus]MBB6437493.1 1-aminocyclopropane-1-carboxylate deaminase [Streptomyces candidus]GHH54353.1 1-aminocyclopropane-1-carboxylate deaminase [Streptomyces candidus]
MPPASHDPRDPHGPHGPHGPHDAGDVHEVRDLRPQLPSPLVPVRDDRFERHGVRLLVKRDDLIHPDLSGNKWRKLAPNLRAAAGRPVLTFGGAYSNHLRATAAAGRLLGFPTVGVVRGDELAGHPLNPSLAQCAADGMHLHFVSRTDYRRRADPDHLAALLPTTPFPDAYVVPEGGSNALAAQGCAELGRELRGAADVVGVACGTGGTLAGLAAGLGPGQRALGVPVLKGGFLEAEVRALQTSAFGAPTNSWTLADGFHFGGYARTPPELHTFAQDFEERHGMEVERLYVAKLLYGLLTLTQRGEFAPGTRLVAVVTGRP